MWCIFVLIFDHARVWCALAWHRHCTDLGVVDQQTTLLTNEAQVEIWWTCWAPMQQGCAEWSDTSLGAQHAGRDFCELCSLLVGSWSNKLVIILIINFSISIQRSPGTLTIQARLSFLKHWVGAGLARPWDVVLHWGEEVFSCKKALILWHGNLSALKLWKWFQNMWHHVTIQGFCPALAGWLLELCQQRRVFHAYAPACLRPSLSSVILPVECRCAPGASPKIQRYLGHWAFT